MGEVVQLKGKSGQDLPYNTARKYFFCSGFFLLLLFFAIYKLFLALSIASVGHDWLSCGIGVVLLFVIAIFYQWASILADGKPDAFTRYITEKLKKSQSCHERKQPGLFDWRETLSFKGEIESLPPADWEFTESARIASELEKSKRSAETLSSISEDTSEDSSDPNFSPHLSFESIPAVPERTSEEVIGFKEKRDKLTRREALVATGKTFSHSEEELLSRVKARNLGAEKLNPWDEEYSEVVQQRKYPDGTSDELSPTDISSLGDKKDALSIELDSSLPKPSDPVIPSENPGGGTPKQGSTPINPQNPGTSV